MRTHIEKRVAKELDLPLVRAKARVDDCLHFLKMCSVSSLPLCPTRAIDDVWHICLEVEGYGDMCRQAFGRVIGHVPASAGSETAMTRARARSYRVAIRMVGRAFAKPWLFTEHGDCCSNCSHIARS